MQATKSVYNLQSAFLSNPELNTLYVTADGMPFKTPEDANRHALNLVKNATPAVAPKAGSVQETTTNAVVKAAGVVTTVTRSGVQQAFDAATQTASPAAAVVTEPVALTRAEAEAANTAAQTALKTAQDAAVSAEANLTTAKTNLANLASTATATVKGKAQKGVNEATGVLEQANVVLEDARVDALLAAQNLEHAPAA